MLNVVYDKNIRVYSYNRTKHAYVYKELHKSIKCNIWKAHNRWNTKKKFYILIYYFIECLNTLRNINNTLQTKKIFRFH